MDSNACLLLLLIPFYYNFERSQGFFGRDLQATLTTGTTFSAYHPELFSPQKGNIASTMTTQSIKGFFGPQSVGSLSHSPARKLRMVMKKLFCKMFEPHSGPSTSKKKEKIR